MSDDYAMLQNNDLWKAFLEEVREQLDALESQLLHVKTADAEEINELFRYFHSIKSSSAIFSFTAIEELAHAAETILDQLRKGRSEVTDEIVSVLLACVDTLKSQLAESEKTLQPPSPDKKLLQKLVAMHLPESYQPLEKTIATEENLLGMESVELQELAELCQMSLTNFFKLMGNDNMPAAIKSLTRLQKTAEHFSLTQLHRAVTALIAQVERETDKNSLFPLLVNIVDQIHALEKISAIHFPLGTLYEYIDPMFGADYIKVLTAVREQLQRCIAEIRSTTGAGNDQLTLLCDLDDELINYFKLFYFNGSVELFRYFNQVCRKSAVLDFSLSLPVFEQMSALVDKHLVAIGEPIMQDEVDLECQHVLPGFRQGLHQQQDDDFHRVERIAALTTLLGIDADYMDYVENSEIELLEDCIKNNKNVAVIVVDVEANQEWSTRFVHWMYEHELITSRTVYCQKVIGGKLCDYTKTSFLVVFDDSRQQVQESLAELGNSDDYIDEISWKYPRSKVDSAITEFNEGKSASLSSIDIESNKTIRVNSDSIDRFVAQVGEMVLQRNMLSHALLDNDIAAILKNTRVMLDRASGGQLGQLQMEVIQDNLSRMADFYSALVQTNSKLAESVGRVQKDVMSLRVVPISIVFNRLPRVVRNINVDYGKDIRLLLQGEQVRVDKSMVDVLMEPLVHLVRNCADHGIETREERLQLGKAAQARITVAANQAGSYLEIKISDDGRGLNFARIREKAVAHGIYDARLVSSVSEDELKQLIFRPGFSTSDKITETSGRGVGMDAVKTRIAAIGGSIDVQSTAGIGTTFTLKLPVSAAIQGVILFRHGSEILTIPERNVMLGLTIPVSQIQSVQGQAAFIYQDEIMPLYAMSELLGWSKAHHQASHHQDQPVPDKTEQEIIIITDDTCHIGLAVDKVIDRQEIFVRELHAELMKLPGVGGASILGNGEVVIILDAEAILRIASKQSQRFESLLKVS